MIIIRIRMDDMDKELTNKQRKIYRFMLYSLSVNGSFIVPPWMLSEAEELYRKLGMVEEVQEIADNYKNIDLESSIKWG